MSSAKPGWDKHFLGSYCKMRANLKVLRIFVPKSIAKRQLPVQSLEFCQVCQQIPEQKLMISLDRKPDCAIYMKTLLMKCLIHKHTSLSFHIHIRTIRSWYLKGTLYALHLLIAQFICVYSSGKRWNGVIFFSNIKLFAHYNHPIKTSMF